MNYSYKNFTLLVILSLALVVGYMYGNTALDKLTLMQLVTVALMTMKKK